MRYVALAVLIAATVIVVANVVQADPHSAQLQQDERVLGVGIYYGGAYYYTLETVTADGQRGHRIIFGEPRPYQNPAESIDWHYEQCACSVRTAK
jgi:hypothetical protein